MIAHKIKSFCLVFFMLISIPSTLFAQQTISGTIHGFGNQLLKLEAIRGDQIILIDSVLTDISGSFQFESVNVLGMYQISTPLGNSLTILYNGEAVQFVTDDPRSKGSLQFVQSIDNKGWSDYVMLRDKVFYLQNMLKPVISDYEQPSPFHSAAVQEFDSLQQLLYQSANSWIADHPKSLAALYIKTDMRPQIDLTADFAAQREDLKKNFFAQTDFGDTLLIRSNILTRKMIDFLSLYQSDDQSMQSVQFEFIKGLDRLFEYASVNETMYIFVLEYMINGFAHLGLPAVTDFISSLPHFDAVCMETESLMQLEQIVGPFRTTLIGIKAPDLISEDFNGEEFSFEQIQKPYTLLVFWSITCPHCLDMLPQLQAFVTNNPDYQLVSVILSKNDEVLHDFIKSEKYGDWIHLNDDLGWESPMAKAYNIFGTPTLFVLNQNQEIVSKPSGIKELQLFVERNQDKN